MKIWVDADACPNLIKEILFRAVQRLGVETVLVANRLIAHPPSPYISAVQVESGFDVADNEILKRCNNGDLVITSDIPLAAEIIANGGHALNPRGEMYDRATIRAKLNMRDFMDTMRSSGIHGGGQPPLGDKEKMAFANALDRFLAKHHQKSANP
jgi:uncharacterized protein YaiI (UPF0178 family)